MSPALRSSMFVLAATAGCEAEPYSSGLAEPIRIREGVFHAGELPEDPEASTPLVTNAGGVGSVVTQGQSSIRYDGLTTPDGYAVAVAFPTLGSGYWVTPVAGPDVTQGGNLLFSLTAEFSREVPYGLQTLSFVAIGGAGNPGPRYDTTICVLPEVAHGSFAACDPSVTPQNAVVSLTWDTNVDLDLIVIAPNGKVVSAKTPTTVLVESGAIPSDLLNDPATGRLSRDSNANCVIDGIRRESLVFPGPPPEGDYRVYASLRSACGRSYVNYQLALYRRVDAEDGTHPVDRTDLAGGELIALQADGGTSFGTYVTTVTLP